MARNIYIDIDRQIAVQSVFSDAEAALPPFIQEDTIVGLRLWLLRNFNGITYEQIAVAGITLEVALGRKIGSTTTYYTQQFTWTPNTDLSQPYFEADFPMNTAGIDTLLGTKPKAGAFFEVKKIEGGTPLTVLSEAVVIHAAVIKTGNLTVPADLTPLSAEAANAAYVKVTHTGHWYLMNANGYGVDIYVDDTGTYHADPITP